MAELGVLITGHIPALITMIVGFVFLVIEMCVPGFGIPGITGIVLMAAGIFLTEPTGMQALLLVLICVALLGVALAIVLRSMAKGRLGHSRLVLNEEITQPQPEEETAVCKAGDSGLAVTDLHPAGLAEMNGERRSVVTAGGFLPAGTPVRVKRVEGNRIEVEKEG